MSQAAAGALPALSLQEALPGLCRHNGVAQQRTYLSPTVLLLTPVLPPISPYSNHISGADTAGILGLLETDPGVTALSLCPCLQVFGD